VTTVVASPIKLVALSLFEALLENGTVSVEDFLPALLREPALLLEAATACKKLVVALVPTAAARCDSCCCC